MVPLVLLWAGMVHLVITMLWVLLVRGSVDSKDFLGVVIAIGLIIAAMVAKYIGY